MLQKIANTSRDYAWGSRTAIGALLGTEPSGRPEAELWLGAHPGSPARLVGDDGTATGETLADIAPDGLPYLLKVLAASSPLSLQAHPTLEQARAGFARENAAGVPLDAPHRNYRDPLHKPEIIYALSDPFLALCGFRPVAQTRRLIAPLADDPRVAPLWERLVDDDSLAAVFEWLISRGVGVEELVAAVAEHDGSGPEWETVRLLAWHYPGDPGIAISLLLNTVALKAGEVLYLPAGNIHAYLDGLGIELMAASDNVLRGGLTPKHVDVPELLRVLDFRPLPLPYLPPESPVDDGVDVYRPGIPDFQLTVVDEGAARRGTTIELPGPGIVLCTSGQAELSSGEQITVRRGEAVYVADVEQFGISGEATLFVASAAPSS